MEKEILKDEEEKMKKAIEANGREMAMVRTGRASPSLLENMKIDCYGTQTLLNQLASISVPEPRLITIQPWDKSIIGDIEKAIMKSDIDLSPVTSGDIIRIPFPPLSEERRKELVKVVHKMAEECRIEIRQQRRDAREQLKSLEKEGKISEDDSRRAQEEMQKMTDRYIEQVDKNLAAKEKEIMEV
jgi:ribosome recycling factor